MNSPPSADWYRLSVEETGLDARLPLTAPGRRSRTPLPPNLG